jgi:hypothetical protein
VGQRRAPGRPPRRRDRDDRAGGIAETPADGQGGLALGLSIAALVVAAGGALLGGFAVGRRKKADA